MLVHAVQLAATNFWQVSIGASSDLLKRTGDGADRLALVFGRDARGRVVAHEHPLDGDGRSEHRGDGLGARRRAVSAHATCSSVARGARPGRGLVAYIAVFGRRADAGRRAEGEIEGGVRVGLVEEAVLEFCERLRVLRRGVLDHGGVRGRERVDEGRGERGTDLCRF